ncbi:MAG: hypothetical protein ACK6CT_13685 [Planctomycetia bacterium]|jgi:hypothetical protein
MQSYSCSPRPPLRPCGFDNPHELIGVGVAETDPLLIMQAAALRIDRIRAAAGSESDLRRSLIATIIVARNEMLVRTAAGTPRPDSCTPASVPAIVPE